MPASYPNPTCEAFEGLALLGMCRAEDDLVALCGLTWSTSCARTPSWVSPLGSGSPFQQGPGPEE